jgi:hypothetical protein
MIEMISKYMTGMGVHKNICNYFFDYRHNHFDIFLAFIITYQLPTVNKKKSNLKTLKMYMVIFSPI